MIQKRDPLPRITSFFSVVSSTQHKYNQNLAQAKFNGDGELMRSPEGVQMGLERIARYLTLIVVPNGDGDVELESDTTNDLITSDAGLETELLSEMLSIIGIEDDEEDDDNSDEFKSKDDA